MQLISAPSREPSDPLFSFNVPVGSWLGEVRPVLQWNSKSGQLKLSRAIIKGQLTLFTTEQLRAYLFFLSKEKNVKIISVGVGLDVLQSELVEIANGKAENVFTVDNYDGLVGAMEKILNSSCVTGIHKSCAPNTNT